MDCEGAIVQEWLDHLKSLNFETKKMFGCYCLYCGGQVVGWIHIPQGSNCTQVSILHPDAPE